MAIKHLGAKRIQGTKVDRKVDSLGSSADGTNVGISQSLGKLGGSPANVLVKDAQATTNTSSSGTTITNSSFTVANNSNRILIVCAFRYGSGGDISGITWNSSESFTRATFRDGSTETGRTEIWYLVNPTATTSNIVTTWDASTSRRGAGVYSFYNAKQTSPIGATSHSDTIATTTTGAITPTVEGSMIVDCIGSGSNGAPTDTLTAGWTSLIGGDDRSFSSQYKVDPTISSANTMAWTFASDKGINWIGVEVKSASTGSSTASGAYSFDGSNDYVQTSTKFNYLHDGTGGSIAFWMKPRNMASIHTNGDIIFDSMATSASNGTGIQIRFKTDKALRVNFTNSSNSWFTNVNSTTTFSDDTWYHIAMTFGSNTVKLYVNGTLEDTETHSSPNTNASNGNFTIGRHATDPSSYGYLDGLLDDIGIYKRVLTATEISDLVNEVESTVTLGSDDFSESGWAVTGNKFSVSGGKVQCAGYTSHAPNDFVYYDLGAGHNAFDQDFILRTSMKNVGVGVQGGYLEFGFTSNSGNADSGNMINGSLNHHMSNNKYLRINGAYGGSVYEHTTQSGGDSDLNGTEYIELKFVKSTGVVTLSAYTDNTYSTVESGCSITYTITESNYSSDDMRYVFFGSVTASGRHLHQDSFFDDMKYYSGASVASTINGALVSSLTNKSELKANYTMDSTTLKTADLSSADWTENFSSSTPTSYYEHYTSNYDGNMVPFKNSSNGLWFDLDDFTGKVVGTLDLQNAGLMSANANDNYWTLRFKINFSGLTNGTGSMWVGLSNNTDASRDTQKFVGVRFKSNSAGFATGASRYTGGSALSGSSGENETGSTASTYSTGTDYYITVMRTSSTTLKAEIRTGSHTGTLLGTSTDTIYAQTGLRYFKVMNNRLSSGTGGQHKGYIYDVEFHDNEANADGCKNDASSTSELDGMTNLPVNTIFLQTDDTPKYYWKQSDNTWSIDAHSAEAIRHAATGDGLFCGGAGSLTNNTSLATNYVWATNSANLPNNLGYSAGGGYKSSFMACGGYIASGSFFDSSTIWNGSAWATAVALDTQRRDTTAYGGNTSSAIIALGRNNSGTEIDSSSKWNGTSWSSAGAIGSNRVGEHVGGDGGDVTMLISGGSSTYRDNFTDKWNGTTWSAVANIPSNMTSHNHAGKSSESAHIATGNSAWAGDWDGTSWTSVTAISGHSTSTPRYTSGGGTKDSHWIMCGLDGGSPLNNCSLWNGSSWSAKGNMTETQYGGLGDGTIR